MKRCFGPILRILIGAYIFTLFIAFPHFVHAQTSSTDSFGLTTVGQEISVPSQTTDIRVTIVRIINIFLGFLGLVAVCIVLYGGYLYMTSRGDEEQVAGAKKLLINGAIGLAIIMAAFGITSFILSRLQSVLNESSNGDGDPTIEGSCSEPGTPYYEQYHNTSRCNGFCALYPLQCCTADNFVVKSITPHTPGDNDFTQMDNTTIRVLFSKRVAGAPENIFKVYSKDNGNTVDITNNFTFSFAEDGSLVEARYTSGNIPAGAYTVEVNDGVRDVSGNTLTTETSCGTFAKNAEFKTGDTPVIDTVFTGLDQLSIDGNSGDDVYSVVQGKEYPLQTTLRDDHGNAYAYIRVYKEGEPNTTLEKYIDGPRLSDGSSKPFVFIYGIRITSKFTPGVTYIAEVTAHDIDGNTKTDTVKFRTVPPTCRNGILDPGEGPEADQGGVCGETEGNSCHTQSDCSYSLQCLDANYNVCGSSGSCTCKAVPYISKVEYMNGAEGNWITIFGKNFGTVPGIVKFNYDLDGDDSIDSSVTASLAQCREGQEWNNSWIIAEVPKKIEGTSVAPSLSVKNTQLAGTHQDVDILDVPALANGNVLNLHLEETSGNSVSDSSVKRNNGVVHGTIHRSISGKVGQAFGFDVDADAGGGAAGQFGAVVVNSQSLDLQQGSVFAWIKKDTPSVYYDGIAVSQGNYGMFIDDHNDFALYDWNGNGVDRWISSGVNVSDGRWHQVGFTFSSGVSNGTKLYIDGRLVKTDTILVAGGGGGTFVVGAGTNDVSSQFFSGSIDEVAVWNKVLSESDVQSLYSLYQHPKFTDFTNDNFGPDLGVFTYTNTVRPNLCSVTVTTDQSVTLDDGTVTTIHAGDHAGTQGIPVTAEGKAFGSSNGSITFGSLAGRVESWSDTAIASVVPFGGEGDLSVYISLNNGEKSNSVPFTVLSTADLHPPTITSIDPSSVTKGSYITISGTGFGNSGNVYFSKTEAAACPTGGCILAGTLPQSCGNTWSNTQVIAKVPNDSTFDLGAYFVVLVRDDNTTASRTSGKDSVTVVSGAPAPSICRIDPTRGYAPTSGTDVLTIYGENFITNSQVKFWFPLAQAANPDSWLSSSLDVVQGGTSIAHITSEKIETGIPYDVNSGLSMSSGPIKVKNSAGLFSNSVHFDVLDCREPNTPQMSGFQCCTEGPEAGRWKQGNFACQDSSREAGYVWRFTTGKVPQKFFVQEMCSEQSLPSPSPSTLWESGTNVCVNAQLQVSFNLPLNLSTIFDQSGNLSNLSIANCGGTGTAINCTQQATDVTNDFSGQALGADAVIFRKKNNSNLSPNTWYRIGLSSSITSLRLESELGQSVQKTEKLESTRSCEINGTTFAYCFDFRTGPDDFMCSLVGAGMEPAEYTTTLLGIVQDPRSEHLTDLNRVFDISALRPLVYGVYGKANLACTSLNVDNKPWVWGPVSGASATAAHMDLQPNSKGYATAWENNVAGSSITAKVTENNQEFTASSTLKIDLGNPYAKTVWPSCIEACVNAEIGIEFNQIMDAHTYDSSKIRLNECTSEACTHIVEPSINLSITPDLQSNTTLRAYPVTPLKKNTWYVVHLVEGVRSIGGVTPNGVIKLGASADTKQWKFRTKDSSQLCLADSVHISPDPFFSTFIGQVQLYRALPAGSPDSCSPYGQQLNPWDYGWNWKVEDTNVAKVSDFSFAGSSKSSCTIGCTPKGSDISREENQTVQNNFPVCGNGTEDNGEDCDIAAPGEKPGISCTFNCLRPGNPDKNTCGNGTVQTALGEQCDPKDTRSDANSAYCSNTCLYTGSSKDQTGVVNVPVCGSGGVTYGESCDTGSTQGSQYCSSKCLNLGTSISQAWCDGWIQYNRNSNSVSPATAQQYAEVSQTEFNQVCSNATSVCGNGVVEQGEECDNESAQCSSQCLVQNACNTAAAQCIKGAPGCLNDCTLAGSSVTYSNPSICGDGIVGVGEYGGDPQTDIRSCELPSGEAANLLGQNPVQIVTSVGNVQSSQSGQVSDIATHVTAQTDRARNQTTGAPTTITGVTGSGDYHLQCGYTEYDAQNSTGAYNNCPANPQNVLGVASNSCCTERPQRTNEYPSANAGLGAGAPVCRNTYISVTFDQNIPAQYIQDNVKLVQSFDPSYSCAAHSGVDVTQTMRGLLAINDVESGTQGLWVRIWNSLKTFFARLLHTAALAAPQPNQTISPNVVWCSGVVPFEAKPSYETDQQGNIIKTTVSIYPGAAFEANQYVVVLLNGGKNGLRSASGVSIKSPFDATLSDYWIFRTGDQICKIKEISVEPTSALFTSPNSSKQFLASAKSGEDQKIVSIPGQYEWAWSWAPQGDALFDIPSTGNAQNTIVSKGVRGHTDGLVRASIVKDNFETNNQQGKVFDTTFSLDALFCQRPWPANGVTVSDAVVSTTALFVDPKYNFSMYYCADSGNPLSVTDDLPYFHQVEVITNPNELGVISSGDLPQALRRYLLFADKTEDVIGIQIFANPTKPDGSRQTLTEWYTDKFGDTAGVKQANVAGYDALVNDFNVYINAFNVDGNAIYNNVYLFSIDTNATSETQQVFQDLMASLRFNINLTNHNRCLLPNIDDQHKRTARETPNDFMSLVCTTDFDCRDTQGLPQVGTNGFCSNAATKFARDVTRLEQMHTVQKKTDAQIANAQINLASGTYIPGYTNSKWPSWGKLGSIIGGAPIDPVNQLAGCSGDVNTCWSVASTTFQCPMYAQTYEYHYDNGTKDYTYYAPFEFIRSSDTGFVSQYVDAKHISFDRWCAPASTISPFGGQCGDGAVNIGEDCDPPGRTMVYDNSCAVGSYAVATCTSACTYSYGACTTVPASCGNGRVEGSEQCDAGAQNGQYGSQCSSDCKVATNVNTPGGQFCGNNKVDFNSQGKALEFCEEVGGACTHTGSNGQVVKTKIHILLDQSASMYYCLNGTYNSATGRCASLNLERWNNTLNGLDQIYNAMSSTVQFSLATFGGTTQNSCYTDLGALIKKPSLTLTGITPAGANTPTNCALKKVFDNRNIIFGLDAEVPKKLVFITDGMPSDTGNFSFADQATSSVHKLYTNSVLTYVLGYSTITSASDKAFLNALAEAGGTRTTSSTSPNLFFTADKTSDFVSTFGNIAGCFEYSLYKPNSCAWNCQAYGEYCGDGVVQQQYGEECEPSLSGTGSCNAYCKNITAAAPVCGNSSVEAGEQCDDGNATNGDGCSSICSFEITGAACGNGPQGGSGQPALDPGEQCDLGTQNGVACTPGYGVSCTYCSSRCLNVTVDPVAYCGNGKVDTDVASFVAGKSPEVCDFDANGVYGFTVSSTGGQFPLLIQNNKTAQVCPDKGNFTCSNACQNLVNNCVSCGRSQALPIPKIAILNPLTQAGKSPYSITTGYVDLLRMNPPGSTTTTLQWLGYRKINYKSEDPNTYIDPFNPYFLFINAQYQPVLTDGLQTNPSCNGEYFLLFNKNHISKLKTSSDTGMSNVQVVQQGLADLFDYPVNGEAGQITDEVVMSPAIYSNQLRIVTRWKKKNGASSAIFMGELYQDQTGGQAGNTFSYFTHVSTDVGGGSATDLNCGEVRKDPSNYYVATNCEDATKQLIMHKILNPTSTITSVQAVTISTSLDSLSPLGFYVTSPNGPINQLKDYELWVDIYTYHPGQIPDLSIYKPTSSFSIQNAIPSTNPTARYWHVFNLVITGTPGAQYPQGLGNRQFTIQPVGTSGAIVTDQCAVRSGMPNTTKCAL